MHLGEFFRTGALKEYDFSNNDMTLEIHQELILLDPHPDANSLIDHDFQSPTFKERISQHIKKYLEDKGEYE